MEWKNILESYNEFTANYCMNEQELIDDNTDYKIAECIATKEAIEMIANKQH